ncbi:hypothetical protein GCM10028827_15920 [Mucilaginibacter myungsuensis]
MLNFFKSLFTHKHQWEVIADSYFETDGGIGMQPIKHSRVTCQKCNIIGDKVEHPMYGTKITLISAETSSYVLATPTPNYSEEVSPSSFTGSLAR